MIFVTEQRPDLPIHSPRLGYTIRFEDGRYETSDPAEIAVLRRSPFATEAPGRDTLEVTRPSREDLNELARQAGVEDPEKLANKDAVIAAIEERRSGEDQPPAE